MRWILEDVSPPPPPPPLPLCAVRQCKCSSQMAVMSVTVFPLRLLATAALMLLAWPFALAASLGRTPFTLETQSLWRR